MADKPKSKYASFHQFLGKASGEALTEKDIQRGLNSSDPEIVKMANAAAKYVHAKKKVAKEEYAELNSARIMTTSMVMEAFAGGDIIAMLNDSLPILVTDIKSFFNRFLPDQIGIAMTFNEAAFIKDISKHSYLDISPLAAFVPEGLNTTYLKYSVVLEAAAAHASVVIIGAINEYSVYLAQLISNNDMKLSTKSFSRNHEVAEKQRITFNEEIGKCFKHGSTVAETNIGNVIDRNADWQHVFNYAETILKMVNSVDRKALNKKIAECSHYLDIILEKVKRNEFEGMTPEAIQNLSSGAYSMACDLEFFSTIYYRALALITSINNTVNHYEKVLMK